MSEDWLLPTKSAVSPGRAAAELSEETGPGAPSLGALVDGTRITTQGLSRTAQVR